MTQLLPQFALTTLLIAGLLSCANSGGQTQRPRSQQPDYQWVEITKNAAFPPSYNFPVFVAKDRMWAFHSEGIWESADGRTWTKTALTPIRRDAYNTSYVQFGEAVYALGDHSGNYERMSFTPRVRRTADFRNWEDLGRDTNMPGRIFYGLVVFNNKIWVLSGYDGTRFHNDVWSSPDGVRWTRVVANAPWSPRTGGTVYVFRNKIHMLGGGVIDGMPNPNPDSDKELWTSPDGISWTRVATNLPNRSGGTPVVFDDKLWLVGANRDGSFARSSLVSEDGATWAELPAPWSPRGGTAAWVFGDKLYMTGGKYSVTENGQIIFIYSNDVWMMSKK